MPTTANQVDATQFAIGFDERDRARLHELWDGVLDSGRWTEGGLTEQLESAVVRKGLTRPLASPTIRGATPSC